MSACTGVAAHGSPDSVCCTRLFASGIHLRDQHVWLQHNQLHSLSRSLTGSLASLSIFDPTSLERAQSHTTARTFRYNSAALGSRSKIISRQHWRPKKRRGSAAAHTTNKQRRAIVFLFSFFSTSCAHSSQRRQRSPSLARVCFSASISCLSFVFLFKLMFALFSSINANPTRRPPTAKH